MLLVKATVAEFLRWLRRETRGLHLRRIRVEGGYLALQTPRLEDLAPGETDDFPVITIDGLYRQHDGGTLLLGRVIYFTLHRLADGRLMVEAECSQDVVDGLFRKLVSGIEERWGDT
jgi:hypothetical protein